MEFEDGVPVAAGAYGADGFLEGLPGELGVCGTIGEMKVDVITSEVVTVTAVGISLDNALEGSGGSGCCGSREERDVDACSVGSFIREWVFADHFFELFVGSNDHVY